MKAPHIALGAQWHSAVVFSFPMRLVFARPLSIHCETYGTGAVPSKAIEATINNCIGLTPRGIRTHLGLNKPIYERTAAYGHFGPASEDHGGFNW